MRRLPLILGPAVVAIGVVSIAAAAGLLDARPAATPIAASMAAASTPTASATASPAPPRPTSPPYIRSWADRPEVVERLQAALDAGRLEIAAPGVQASVIFADGHQWTGVSGVADLATGRPLTTATPFPIASVSKTFLAAEVLTLIDAGRLSLTDSVTRLLPTTLVGGAPIDPAIFFSASRIASRSRASRLLSGSSISRTSGSRSRMRARAMRIFHPPEKLSTGR